MRRGMESISLWHCSGVMRAQVALIVAFSSFALLGLAYRIFLFTIPHRFSMGLRSGEFAGQLRTGIPWSLNQVLVNIYIYIYISGGPLSALTCCVNVRLLSGDKKNIAVNLFSKLGWELGLYYASYDDFHPDILARMYT